MAVGETILKVTGFPFAYSFMVILFRSSEWNIDSNDYIPFLIVAGTVGTFLSIIDPVVKFVIIQNSDLKNIKSHGEGRSMNQIG